MDGVKGRRGDDGIGGSRLEALLQWYGECGSPRVVKQLRRFMVMAGDQGAAVGGFGLTAVPQQSN